MAQEKPNLYNKENALNDGECKPWWDDTGLFVGDCVRRFGAGAFEILFHVFYEVGRDFTGLEFLSVSFRRRVYLREDVRVIRARWELLFMRQNSWLIGSEFAYFLCFWFKGQWLFFDKFIESTTSHFLVLSHHHHHRHCHISPRTRTAGHRALL